MRYSIGVDLGTTSIAVAIGDELGTRAAQLSPLLVEPSVAFCSADGTILTGQAALRAAQDDPTRLVRGFKRRVGDPTPIIVGGVGFAPEALMAAQLRDVVARLTELQGQAPDRVVLTCPAAWGPYRREQFSHIAALSGVAVDEIVTDPVATATHVSRDRGLDEGAIVAVFDLGGRTFDATVLRRGADGLEVLGSPEGVEHLGGDDFDDAVRGLLDQRVGGRISALDAARPDDAATLAAIDEACTSAKEALSVREDTVVLLPFADADQSITLTRADLERAIRPSIGLAVAALLRTIDSAGIDAEAVSTVILAGGSSRIPLVAEEVAALGRPVAATHHPKFTVALGAAERARGIASPEAELAVVGAGAGAGVAPSAATGAPAGAVRAASTASSTGTAAAPRASDSARTPWRLTLHRGTAIVLGAALAAVIVAAIVVAAVLGRAGGVEAANSQTNPASGPSASVSAEPTVTASPAPDGADGKSGTKPTVASPIFTSGSSTAGLAWFVQSNDANGTWGVTSLAEGSASRPDLTLTQSDAGLRAVWAKGGPAQTYAQTDGTPIDLSDIAADDGALVFDVTRNSGAAEQFEIAVHCGYPCGAAVDMTSIVNGFPPGTTQHVIIPAECFTASGLKPGSVDTPFLALSTGDLDLTFTDIRWENLTGADVRAVRCGT
ncbi:Hsp70 family protein [Schumannella sp. 10F1B-5-1]|uniref:Hsp70 family protein n=1 Tax=Schumannella sp. 10F1B-5-1 TaxID=2590780 RepID=UPI00112FF110|nr:Hsp70 family protein [Schumannella sp. 10F1B-5-1]TPW76687.1 Hsp70 family protein [Schumannella sp. 10F1B-5-1]